MADESTDSLETTEFSEQFSRLDLIYNVVSGSGDPEEDLEAILSILKKSFPTVRVWRTTEERDGHDLALDAVKDGAKLLVASGGDGTVAGVATAIKSSSENSDTGSESPDGSVSPIILGIIPRGTANALCSALHIPQDITASASMIASGPRRKIDFPTIESSESDDQSTENRPPAMLLLCGIGLEAETVRRTDGELKKSIGAGAYAVAGLKTILEHASFRADITLYDTEDELPHVGGTTQSKELRLQDLKLQGLTVANAAPPTSVLAQGVGEVHPDDGLLEVVCIACEHPIGMIRTMLSMLRSAFLRTRIHRKNVYGLRAKRVEIECDPPQRIVIDGEEAGFTPITIELKTSNDQIQIIAPEADTVNRQKRQRSRSIIRLWRNVRGIAIFAVALGLLKKSRTGRLF